MQLRTVLTLFNFGAMAAAIAVLLLEPQWAGPAFYVLLGWMFVSLALMYSRWATRPIGGSSSLGGATLSPDAPLAASAGHVHSSSLGFCMYCAAPIEPGTARCPACGRALPHFS